MCSNSALEITSCGPAGDYQGNAMGRFDLIVGEEHEGSPVYEQAHSRGMPSIENHMLYRLEKLTVLYPHSHQVWRGLACLRRGTCKSGI